MKKVLRNMDGIISIQKELKMSICFFNFPLIPES